MVSNRYKVDSAGVLTFIGPLWIFPIALQVLRPRRDSTLARRCELLANDGQRKLGEPFKFAVSTTPRYYPINLSLR